MFEQSFQSLLLFILRRSLILYKVDQIRTLNKDIRYQLSQEKEKENI